MSASTTTADTTTVTSASASASASATSPPTSAYTIELASERSHSQSQSHAHAASSNDNRSAASSPDADARHNDDGRNTTNDTANATDKGKGRAATPTDAPNEPIPEAKLAAAAQLSVFDARGNRIRFGALFELERTVVVFVRHFFCGSCQAYVSQLTRVRPEALERAGTKVVVVGCGDWLLIGNYRDLTCPTPHALISYYADPTRTLYRALGLTTESLATTPKDAPKRSYLTAGRLQNTARSILRALKNPLHLGRQGNIAQLGGEFVLGPQNTCVYGHYMRHTEDHAEVADVYRAAGVAFP